jgi:FkbM family methyltransferase
MSRKFRSLAKKAIYGYLPGTSGSFPYFGSKVFFPPGAGSFDIICKQGIFEPDVVNVLTKLVEPNTMFFDVGANVGLMALPVLQACSTCRVTSFEPSPNSLPFLRQTVETSVHRTRWSVVAKALSDQEGQMKFFLGEAKDSLFDGLGNNRQIQHQRSVTVPVGTLDKEWQALGEPEVSLIKIDVEGAEGLVLDGGLELLKTQTPSLVVEWYEDYLRPLGTCPERLLVMAQDFGYRAFSIPSGVPIDEASALKVQMMICSNFLLLPSSSPRRRQVSILAS